MLHKSLDGFFSFVRAATTAAQSKTEYNESEYRVFKLQIQNKSVNVPAAKLSVAARCEEMLLSCSADILEDILLFAVVLGHGNVFKATDNCSSSSTMRDDPISIIRSLHATCKLFRYASEVVTNASEVVTKADLDIPTPSAGECADFLQ